MKNKFVTSMIPALLIAAVSQGQAAITSPLPNTSLNSETVTFEWESLGSTNNYIAVKDGPNGNYIQGLTNYGTNTSATLTLPTDGSPLYVVLSQNISGSWIYKTFYYTAADLDPRSPEMLSPIANSTLGSTDMTFQWEDVGAAHHVIYVGSSIGKADYIHDSYNTGTSLTITNLPYDGSAVYVRIHSYFSGTGWVNKDYQFTNSHPN